VGYAFIPIPGRLESHQYRTIVKRITAFYTFLLSQQFRCKRIADQKWGRTTTIKGYKNKDEIAVFEVDLTTDLSISAIRIVKAFENDALMKAVFDSMKKDLILVKPRYKTTSNSTQMLVFCYYYEKDTGESYMSLF